MNFYLSILKPGDIMLFNTLDLVDDVIDFKTGSDVAHIEIYAGGSKSYASRNGIGVGLYPVRITGLRYVRRPVGVLDIGALEDFFNKVDGAKYGFGDILENINWNLPLPGYDCSHFAAALLRYGNCPQFDGTYPEPKITPRDFLITRESQPVWSYNA